MNTLSVDRIKYRKFFQKHARDLLIERARNLEKDNVWYDVDINPTIVTKDDFGYPWFVHVTMDGKYILGHLFGGGGAYEINEEALPMVDSIINSRSLNKI